MSNNFTQNARVSDRVNKSWGYNVGPGPIWELVEDRGWYKEAMKNTLDMDSDGNRRPKVYKNILVKSGWQVLDKRDAAIFLPTDVVTTEEGNFKPPPPVTCLLGPFGEQTETKIEMFQSHKMSEFFPEATAHVFNAGAPVWGLDWCPTHIDDRPAFHFKQYLAVAPFPSASHSPDIGAKVVQRGRKHKEPDLGEMKCEMVLCVEGGPAHELKWCPLPSHDDVGFSSNRRPRKLGLLSGIFEDGSWSIYVVPYPTDVTPEHGASHHVYVHLPEPLLRIELEETSCWTCDWANSEQVAIGTTNDVINAMAFSPFGGGPVTIDHENIVKAYSASPSMLGRGHTLLEPQGPVWSVNASDLHPQLAVGSADGCCTTTNLLRSTRRGGSVPFFIHKIYQLDYSRTTGMYRMLERFFPQETQDRPATKAKVTKASNPKVTHDGATQEQERIKASTVGTGAWPREVGVHRVTWNSCNGLASSGLLASATASGLCRVDELWGRWIKEKVPYGGIEHIRQEMDDNVMDVDGVSDDSAGSS
ncbi:hypothetical protein C0993_008426 [Termitomyces sp. T159_Od127]|nr:hypothetical protein C0993_008426 [Termitomyces sp. T159_Od127]